MKWKVRGFCLLALLLMISGCDQKKQFTITFFYWEGCGYCESARSVLLKEVKETFGSAASIEEINLDDEEGMSRYDEITGYYRDGRLVQGKLKDFPLQYLQDENYMYQTPLIVVGDKYAFLGFDSRYLDTYISDMKKGLCDEPMSQLLSEGRYLFDKE